MRIRLANESDLPTLKKLVGYACQELESEYGTPREDDLVFAAIVYGISTGQAVVVAEQEQLVIDGKFEIIGWCARVRVPGLAEGHCGGIGTWTFEPFRREGVGRDMRKFADEHAKAQGMKFVTGIASVENEAGIKSCLAEGYVITGYQLRKVL